MERYEAYKDSGIQWAGKIPEHWTIAKGARALNVVYGYPFESDSFSNSEGWPLIRIRDVGSNTTEALFDGPFVDSARIEAGDIIVGMDGDYRVARWNGPTALLNQRVCSLRDSSSLGKDYLLYLMPEALGFINDLTYGTTVKHLGAKDLNSMSIVCPPLKDQRLIAGYLDAKTSEIDALVADCEREVELLREYRKAVISEAVTKGLDPDTPMKDSGVEWIGKIPLGWRITPLKFIVDSIESGTSIDGANWPADEDEKGVLTLSAVYQSRFDSNQNKAVLPAQYERLSCPLISGTLLISRCNTSEWVGTAAYVNDAPANLFLPDKLWQLSFECDSVCRYIQYALQASAARSYFAALSVGASSTMQNISKSDLLAVPIATPNSDGVPEIVRFLDSKTTEIDSLIHAKQAMVDKLREYRRSLISEAVTGKFKVPGV